MIPGVLTGSSCLVRCAIKADKKQKLKLKISNTSVIDNNFGLLLDAATNVENLLRSKIFAWRAAFTANSH